MFLLGAIREACGTRMKPCGKRDTPESQF